MIPFFGLAKQYKNLKDELLDATDQVLNSGNLMNGPFTTKLETWLALQTGSSYAITVHSGTQALEIIAQFTKQQWLIVTEELHPYVYIPNITYPATLNAFINAGFQIELVETDKNGLIDEAVIKKLPFLHNVVQVGFCGAKTYEANSSHIIDGAQHWLIADKNSIGLGMAISFDPTKNLPASGNGGAILTNDMELYEFATNYRSNGKPGSHASSGTNSRMSELDCSHVLVRSKYINDWQWRRKQIRYYYLEQFKNLPIRCLSRDFTVHADQKFAIYTDNRDSLQTYLKNQKIETKIHYSHALSELGVSKYTEKKPDLISTSVMLTKGLLSLPIYPELSDSEVEYISTTVKKFYDK